MIATWALETRAAKHLKTSGIHDSIHECPSVICGIGTLSIQRAATGHIFGNQLIEVPGFSLDSLGE
jgi:hypothetical protein